MIAGPRITDCSMTAPASITTLPSTRDSSSTVPSIRRSSVSRISRFASSMSSSLPVSFHQPSTRCGVTVEAAIDQVLDRVGDLELVAEARLDALDRIEDRRRRTCRRRPARGCSPAPSASRPAARPGRRCSSATPNICGSGTGVSRICAAGCSRTNCSTNGTIPLLSRLSPRYITNGSSPMNGSLIRTACARPRGASCSM